MTYNFSEKQKKEICDLYEDFSLEKISKKFNCSEHPIRRIIAECGVKIAPNIVRNRDFNKPFWTEILDIYAFYKYSKRDKLILNILGMIIPKDIFLDEEKIIELYKTKNTVEIAKQIGNNHDNISNILKQNSVSIKRKDHVIMTEEIKRKLSLSNNMFSEKERKKIYKLSFTKTQQQLAEQFGCSRVTIYRIIKKNRAKK